MYMDIHLHGRLLRNYLRLINLLVFMPANIALYIWAISHGTEMRANKPKCFIDMLSHYHHPADSHIIN